MSPLDLGVLAGLERDLGDVEFVREVVQLFLDQLSSRQEVITAAVEAGDATGLQREAHTLGSASAMVGAVELRGLCRQLENADTAASVSPTDPLVQAWSASCGLTRVALTDWLAP